MLIFIGLIKLNHWYLIEYFKIDIDTNRIFGLDILRAIAIMLVVIGHGSILLPGKLKQISDFILPDGVSIFFVLSGFLVGGILIKLIHKNGFSVSILKVFWIRRWFRTLPNYFLILSILCMLELMFSPDFTLTSVLKYFIFSQNVFQIHPPFFPESWSLTVEEWFYLTFPVIILFSSLFRITYQKSIFYMSILVIVLITALRYYRFSNVTIDSTNEWGMIFRRQVITRLDSIMFGVAGAYVYYFHENLWIKYKKQLFFLGILMMIASKIILPMVTPINGLYSCVFSFSLISTGVLFLLPYLSELKTANGPLYKPITTISLISYSMYLLNLTIVQNWIIRSIPWNFITDNAYLIIVSNYCIYWILVIGLSILLYKYFEIPMTSLRERFK